MKILVIFTGGTIGSSVQGEFIGTDRSKKFKIIDSYLNTGRKVDFDILEPYTILSENLQGAHIDLLANSIVSNCKGYDGVIVTHGTDTLQYTAAGLSFMLNELSLPVMLVSSNYVLEDERSNGARNFAAAVDYIEYAAYSKAKTDTEITSCNGIFVAYNNGGAETFIHSGSTILPHAAYEDRIYSIDNLYAGFVRDGVYIHNPRYDYRQVKESIDKAREIIISSGIQGSYNHGSMECDEKSKVVWLKEHPGCKYQIPDNDTKCVLLETYHSGTLCAQNTSLKRLLDYCRDNNIPVFISGMEERIRYESIRSFEDCMFYILPKISPILAYMMLWII